MADSSSLAQQAMLTWLSSWQCTGLYLALADSLSKGQRKVGLPDGEDCSQRLDDRSPAEQAVGRLPHWYGLVTMWCLQAIAAVTSLSCSRLPASRQRGAAALSAVND